MKGVIYTDKLLCPINLQCEMHFLFMNIYFLLKEIIVNVSSKAQKCNNE